MAKKYTLEFYDVYEIEKEIGIAWDDCSFSIHINDDDTYYTLYCRDVDIKASKENSEYFGSYGETARSNGYANTAKWQEYFNSLGYKESVMLHIYW